MLPFIELKKLILLFYVCKELSANENEMKNELMLGILKLLGPNTRKMTSR